MSTVTPNLVRRVVLALVVLLFALPCIACQDALSACRGHHAEPVSTAVQGHPPGREGAPPTGRNHDASDHDGPPCRCLSDSSKIRNDRPTVVAPDLAPALPPPPAPSVDPVITQYTHPDCPRSLPPNVLLNAASGRAPPAA